MAKLNDIIVSTIKSYIGVEETPNNSGFKQDWFLKLMLSVGWIKGQSWCAYTSNAAWFEGFKQCDPVGLIAAKKYANGSCVSSYRNFAKSKEFHVQQTPVLGALVYFQHGAKDSTTGHAGIVTEITKDGYVFVSGNTSAAGSREGTTVLPKTKVLNQPFNPTGLNLMGFVNPIRIA